jgi:acetyl esterase/lipase
VNTQQSHHWHIIESLIDATGATVTVPMYPLAPEHDFNGAIRMLTDVYRSMINSGHSNRMILAGESAGGNLALVQAMVYRDSHLPPPRMVILLSPWLDASLSDPASLALEKDDPVLRVATLRQSGKWWAGSLAPNDPLISPINGNLAGLPLIQIYQGTHDILLPDARRLRDLIRKAGGQVEYYETPGGFHLFMGATFTPEAKQVYAKIGTTLRR